MSARVEPKVEEAAIATPAATETSTELVMTDQTAAPAAGTQVDQA